MAKKLLDRVLEQVYCTQIAKHFLKTSLCFVNHTRREGHILRHSPHFSEVWWWSRFYRLQRRCIFFPVAKVMTWLTTNKDVRSWCQVRLRPHTNTAKSIWQVCTQLKVETSQDLPVHPEVFSPAISSETGTSFLRSATVAAPCNDGR